MVLCTLHEPFDAGAATFTAEPNDSPTLLGEQLRHFPQIRNQAFQLGIPGFIVGGSQNG
jgi:hypothetical protein